VTNPLAALNPPVRKPASRSRSATVGVGGNPGPADVANTGREAMMPGNENGVQFPWANAFSNTAPSPASASRAGVRVVSPVDPMASARSESTVTRTTFEVWEVIVVWTFPAGPGERAPAFTARRDRPVRGIAIPRRRW
jgi:hypothetical protein